MTSKIKRRSPVRAKARAARPEWNPRNVVLAGIGAVALGRRQARAAIEDLVANAGTYQTRSSEVAHAAGQRVARFAKQAKATLAPIQRQAEAYARDAEREFEAVVAPVLVKIGLVDAPKRRVPARARKTTARKSTARAKPAARRAPRRN